MNGWVAVAVSSLVVVAVALQASSLVAQAHCAQDVLDQGSRRGS